MFLRPIGRSAIAAAAVSLALVVSVAPAHAAPPKPVSPVKAAADVASRWQASQLTQGRIHNNQFDFDDWGLTVDTALMLAADGGRPAALKRITTAIENNYYANYVAAFGSTSSGAAAKTLLVAKALGQPVRDFGGHNVRMLLLGLMAPADAGFERGRFRDDGASDFSNTFGQAYGVIALARTGGAPQEAVTYLRKQQCAAGYFRLAMTVGKSCDTKGSKANVDATSLGIQAMLSARTHGATVPQAAILRATRWLLAAQRPNGSFGGGGSTAAPNANSTGLASQALVVTGHRAARLKAAHYILTLQITKARAGNGPARRSIGAIAYNKAALTLALKHGITVEAQDQFRRATPMAFFALVPKALGTLSAP